MNSVCQWKVSYENLQWKAGRYPFSKQSSIVTAVSRKDAIEEVKTRFSPPNYGKHRASKVRR
jgi:hypothetical protein